MHVRMGAFPGVLTNFITTAAVCMPLIRAISSCIGTTLCFGALHRVCDKSAIESLGMNKML